MLKKISILKFLLLILLQINNSIASDLAIEPGIYTIRNCGSNEYLYSPKNMTVLTKSNIDSSSKWKVSSTKEGNFLIEHVNQKGWLLYCVDDRKICDLNLYHIKTHPYDEFRNQWKLQFKNGVYRIQHIASGSILHWNKAWNAKLKRYSHEVNASGKYGDKDYGWTECKWIFTPCDYSITTAIHGFNFTNLEKKIKQCTSPMEKEIASCVNSSELEQPTTVSDEKKLPREIEIVFDQTPETIFLNDGCDIHCQFPSILSSLLGCKEVIKKSPLGSFSLKHKHKFSDLFSKKHVFVITQEQNTKTKVLWAWKKIETDISFVATLSIAGWQDGKRSNSSLVRCFLKHRGYKGKMPSAGLTNVKLQLTGHLKVKTATNLHSITRSESL